MTGYDEGSGTVAARDGGNLMLRIAPNARYAHWVRERVIAFADAHHVAEDDLREFVTALGEALANAIEHAKSDDEIAVTCWVDGDDKLVATVVDSGTGFEADSALAPELPPATAERGRGVPLMRRCTDIFEIRSAPGRGTEVFLGRYLRSRPRTGERRSERASGDTHHRTETGGERE